jgi:cell division protein FtsB
VSCSNPISTARSLPNRLAITNHESQLSTQIHFTSRAALWFTSHTHMNVNLGIWDKLTKLAIFCLFILGLVAVGVWYLPLINQNQNMRKDLLKLEAKIKAAKEQERALETAFNAARSNPKTIERLARANLGYAKPGEIVVRFEAPGQRR